MSRRLATAATIGLIALVPDGLVSPAAAQDPAPGTWRCDGTIVSTIVVERQPPTVIGRSAPEWARPFLSVALQHKTTQSSAVLPFLQLKEGEPCTEFRRAESERVLRVQPYLADATVVALPDSEGYSRVHVATVDEIPLVMGANARRGRIAGVKYGSLNVAGAGMYGAAEWREGFRYRDGAGVRFVNYHVFDGPNRFLLSLDRSPLTTAMAVALQRPVLTTNQRVAWHVGLSDGSTYTWFARPAAAALALPMDHTRLDLGAVFRLGGETRRGFAGLLIGHERLDPASQPVVVTDTGLAADPDVGLTNRFRGMRSTRVAAVVGTRLLSFAKVQGFDALVGTQDVARGVEVATIGGRSFSAEGNGTIVGASLYAGAGTPRTFVALSGRWEGERLQGPSRWADVIGSGRLAWYRKLSDRRTVIASGEFAGAWQARRPYQISLGDPGGLRGYRRASIVGARRALARAEHRWIVGNVKRFATVGAAGFADMGFAVAGDVPFGMNSGLRTSVGAGLLAAIPSQSRRMIRLDVALPLVRDGRVSSYELRMTMSSPPRIFWQEPTVVSSMRRALPQVEVLGLP